MRLDIWGSLDRVFKSWTKRTKGRSKQILQQINDSRPEDAIGRFWSSTPYEYTNIYSVIQREGFVWVKNVVQCQKADEESSGSTVGTTWIEDVVNPWWIHQRRRVQIETLGNWVRRGVSEAWMRRNFQNVCLCVPSERHRLPAEREPGVVGDEWEKSTLSFWPVESTFWLQNGMFVWVLFIHVHFYTEVDLNTQKQDRIWGKKWRRNFVVVILLFFAMLTL